MKELQRCSSLVLVYAVFAVLVTVTTLVSLVASSPLSSASNTNIKVVDGVDEEREEFIHFPCNIVSVYPGLVSIDQRYTNLSIGFTIAPSDLDCVRCGFNGTQGNVSTAGEYFPGPDATVYCPYDAEEIGAAAGSVTEVWLMRCDTNEQFTANTWPLYVYDEVPSITSVEPSPIIATGGTELTVEASMPFDALRLSSKLQATDTGFTIFLNTSARSHLDGMHDHLDVWRVPLRR